MSAPPTDRQPSRIASRRGFSGRRGGRCGCHRTTNELPGQGSWGTPDAAGGGRRRNSPAKRATGGSMAGSACLAPWVKLPLRRAIWLKVWADCRGIPPLSAGCRGADREKSPGVQYVDTRHGDFDGCRERTAPASAPEGLLSVAAGAGKIAKAARRAEAGARERESTTPAAEPVRDRLITVCDGANFRTRPSRRREEGAARVRGVTHRGGVRVVGTFTDDRRPTTGGVAIDGAAR